MSMGRRILLTAVAVCALGVVVLFVPLALVVRDQNQHKDLLEQQRLAAVLAHQLPADPAAVTGPISPAGQAGPADADHRYAVYDPAGRRVAGDGPATADPVVTEALTGVAAGGVVGSEIVGALATGPGGGVSTGVVRVAEPIQESVARTQATIAGMAALALGAIAVAAVAGRLLFRRLLRPLDQLRASATQLGDGDFTVTAPRSGMSELDQVAVAVDATATRIGELVGRERAFSADASHQLKTPLAAAKVVLETELLSPRPDPTAVLHETVGALDRMAATVDELLRLARDDHTGRARIRVDDVLADAGRRWAGGAYRQHGRLLRVVPAAAGHVHASQAALAHILDVLLDNALHHGTGTVTLAAVPAVGGVAVTVTDTGSLRTGTGELFGRRRSGADGTGIGLALAGALAEAEGARLRLRDRNPTTFELVLPTAGPASAAADPAPGTGEPPNSTGPRSLRPDV